MTGRLDRLVDKQNLAVRADVERPAEGKRTLLSDHTVGFRYFAAGVAQNREVEFQRFSESFVLFGKITTRSEIGRVELTQVVAALTERLAFLRSATGERFGIPGHDHDLFVLEVR